MPGGGNIARQKHAARKKHVWADVASTGAEEAEEAKGEKGEKGSDVSPRRTNLPFISEVSK